MQRLLIKNYDYLYCTFINLFLWQINIQYNTTIKNEDKSGCKLLEIDWHASLDLEFRQPLFFSVLFRLESH